MKPPLFIKKQPFFLKFDINWHCECQSHMYVGGKSKRLSLL